MKSNLDKTLQRLARRQRNRIWLDRMGCRLGPLAGYIATVFILAGGIHQLVLPLNPWLVSGVAVLPALLCVAMLAASLKPGEQEGAAAADRLLGAHSLLVSAWELGRSSSALNRVEQLLMRRCESALPGWSSPAGHSPYPNLQPGALLALTLAIAGIFFVLQPSHVQPLQTRTVQAESPTRVDTVSTAVSLSKLLDNGSNPAPQAAAQTPGSNAGTDPFAPGNPADLAATEPSAGAESAASVSAVSKLPASPAGRASSAATTAANEAGTTRHKQAGAGGAGMEAAAGANAGVVQAAEFSQMQMIDIETGGNDGSRARDPAQASELLASNPGRVLASPSVNSRSQQIHANGIPYQLSPLQRNLVWRYMAKLDDIDDPDE